MRTPRAPRIAVEAALMLAVAMGIGRFAFTPLLPMMQKDSGLTLTLGGWLATANYLGYFLGAYSAGRLRVAPAKLVPLALVATALLTAGMAATASHAAWVLLRGLAGIASAWVLIYVSTWSLHHLAALGRLSLRGLVFAGVGLGIMGAGLLCMGFLSLGWSSERSWVALGVAALLVSLVSLPGFMATSTAADEPAEAHAGQKPRVFGIALAYGIFGFGYIIPATFLPAMAKQSIPDPALFGWAWPLFGLAALISTLIAGRLMVRYSNRAVWGISHLVMGAGAVLPLVLSGMAGIMLSALCVGGTFMVITSAGIQEARRLAPADPAPLMAKLTMAFALGQILGPLCASLMPARAGGFSLLLGLATGLLLLSGGLLLSRRPQVADM